MTIQANVTGANMDELLRLSVGILYGTMTLELGGKVTIECQKTKCFSELEFKLKVLFSLVSQLRKS